MLDHGLIKHLPGSLINGGHRLEANGRRPEKEGGEEGGKV